LVIICIHIVIEKASSPCFVGYKHKCPIGMSKQIVIAIIQFVMPTKV
jgi:hypothetical protein